MTLSQHRVLLDADQVRGLLRAQFPQWADLPIEPVLPGGWDNQTFRLGADLSVRFPSAECYVAQVEKEQRWLPVLAKSLPVAVPQPVALGEPSSSFPWAWSVYRWLPGRPWGVAAGLLEANVQALGEFLQALQSAPNEHAPEPGEHNFYRGAPLTYYDEQTRLALARWAVQGEADELTRIWAAGLETVYAAPPVWLHGDIAPGNLLVDELDHLSAVIDFGCCAVGDPACDYAFAWSAMSRESRALFREAISPQRDAWLRGCCWALWKAVIVLEAQERESRSELGRARIQTARHTLEQIHLDQRVGLLP